MQTIRISDALKKLVKTEIATVCFLTVFLSITTYFAFHLLTFRYGPQTGYFLGFVFYWLFWCFTIPFFLFGKKFLNIL